MSDAAEASNVTKAREQLAMALACKEAGTTFYKAKDMNKAMRKYHEGHLYTKGITSKAADSNASLTAMGGMTSSPLPEELKTEIDDTHFALLNNISAIHFNNKKYERAIKYTTEVLDQQPTNKSALLRRGKSNWGFDKLQAAETDITKYLEIDPTNKSALNIKGKIDARNKEYAKQAAGMYKGMFG